MVHRVLYVIVGRLHTNSMQSFCQELDGSYKNKKAGTMAKPRQALKKCLDDGISPLYSRVTDFFDSVEAAHRGNFFLIDNDSNWQYSA